MAKILIVDDDPDIVEAIKLVLENEGHETTSACNRDEGMKTFKDFNPELIILDVMMKEPDDGIAMAQELRRQDVKIPILMLTNLSKVTGFSFDKDDSVVPVDAFVEKPVEPAALAAKVKELLN